MAGRDYCCCQLNSPWFFWLLLAFSPFSGSERSPAGSLYPLGYLQPGPPAMFIKFHWKWNPLEQESQRCKVSWGKVWCKCLGPSVPWGGIIVIVAALVVLLIPLGAQSTLEKWIKIRIKMVIFITLYGSTKKFFFFPCIGCSG